MGICHMFCWCGYGTLQYKQLLLSWWIRQEAASWKGLYYHPSKLEQHARIVEKYKPAAAGVWAAIEHVF
jgi:hypothetical protein